MTIIRWRGFAVERLMQTPVKDIISESLEFLDYEGTFVKVNHFNIFWMKIPRRPFFAYYWAAFSPNLSSKRILGARGFFCIRGEAPKAASPHTESRNKKTLLPPGVPQTLTTRRKQTQNARRLAMKLDLILICAESLIQVSYKNWPHKNIHCK